MDELYANIENEPQVNDWKRWIPDFTNFDTLTNNTSRNRTTDFEENTFNFSLSLKCHLEQWDQQILKKNIKLLSVNIWKISQSIFKIWVQKYLLQRSVSKNILQEVLLQKICKGYQLSNADIINKKLSSNKNVTYISQIFYSHLQYLGYSLLHELFMTICIEEN